MNLGSPLAAKSPAASSNDVFPALLSPIIRFTFPKESILRSLRLRKFFMTNELSITFVWIALRNNQFSKSRFSQSANCTQVSDSVVSVFLVMLAPNGVPGLSCHDSQV